MGQTREAKLLQSMKPQIETKVQIASECFIPNHSGKHQIKTENINLQTNEGFIFGGDTNYWYMGIGNSVDKLRIGEGTGIGVNSFFSFNNNTNRTEVDRPLQFNSSAAYTIYDGIAGSQAVFQPRITFGTSTASPADAVENNLVTNTARTVTYQGGTAFSPHREYYFVAPTIAASVAKTISTAATVCISGPPVQGTNLTCTNKYSLWVQSGWAEIDCPIKTSVASNTPNLYLHSSTGPYDALVFQPYSDDGYHIATNPTEGQGNHNIIITAQVNRSKDHDHDTASSNPTLIIHSNTDPDTDNTQWVSFTHNQTDSRIESGKGGLLQPCPSANPTMVNGAIAFSVDETLHNLEIDVKDSAGVADTLIVPLDCRDYGSCYGNEIGWSQAAAVQNTWYDISDSDITTGQLNGTTHSSGQFTIARTGKYICQFDASVQSNQANKHIQMTFSINGTESGQGQNHVESVNASASYAIGGCAILSLTATDTLNLSIRTTDAGGPTLTVDHYNVTLLWLK